MVKEELDEPKGLTSSCKDTSRWNKQAKMAGKEKQNCYKSKKK